ncbi:alpha/beta-hydrolase [Lindgomyces ingoldianus]|uniref:Alpha/beta-hydrolase n=1 Tax=Lindgomyces ingoldianus TaxID=673940 RepID=A0ACB6QA07_9PLEO|nr:alpha/beta-hydrolase [Lindgomyces ingoldianus]KAF2463874.1 alpha/beta-hydrolase [Lindgomyces ingoldianus]
MDSFGFNIMEHVIACQHIRGYRNATKDATTQLRLAVKQYTPKEVPSPRAITIIATHANGVPKEAYEPLWEELRLRLGSKLRDIWIADCAHQGASGVLNENLLGDDPNWFDHSRDLLGMVNHFRDSIQPPIVGLGHSMGCAQLVQLSTIHPRLFQGLVFVEPVMLKDFPPGPNAALFTSYRPDLWSSLDEAQEYFRQNKFYKTWDRRVVDIYLRYGLRPVPTALYMQEKPGSVTLTTPKHQEAWSYVRSNFGEHSGNVEGQYAERLTSGDLDSAQSSFLFHRAEPGLALEALPFIQPSVLWIFAEESYINRREDMEFKLSTTGSQNRASGGAKAGSVRMEIVRKAGHLLPLEKVAETANAIVPYVKDQIQEFLHDEDFWAYYDAGRSEPGRLALSQRWMEEVRKKANEKRPNLKMTKL